MLILRLRRNGAMKKLLLVASLAALTVLSASAFAQEVPPVTPDSDESAQMNEVGERVKRDVSYGIQNQKVLGGQLQKKTFDVPEDHGWGKIYVRNGGNSSLTVNLERVSDNKDTVLGGHISGSTATVRVEPGQSKTIYTERPTGTGEHRVQLNSSEAELNARVTYKYSDNKNDL
jgi:opacity protein-like surface antigen